MRTTAEALRGVLVDRSALPPAVLAEKLVEAYEAHVTTQHLEGLRARRGPGATISAPPIRERPEKRCCRSCRGAIRPGQAYVIDGPYHVRCSP